MPHAQQTILQAVQAALSGATSAGARVFLDRPDPLTAAELPAILIEEGPGGETAGAATVGGADERAFTVMVTGVVKGAVPAYAAAARELGLQIEQVLGARTFAAPRPGRMRITASRINTHGTGEVPMAAREQIWTTTYFTRRAEPDKPF